MTSRFPEVCVHSQDEPFTSSFAIIPAVINISDDAVAASVAGGAGWQALWPSVHALATFRPNDDAV